MSMAMNADHPEKRTRSLVYLVLTALLWSMGGLLIKSINWNSLAIAGMRSAIAAILILAVLRRPRINWSLAQIGGALAYAATVILFVTANKLTTAANAILLQYTAPIYVALFGAWFLKERVRWFDGVIIVAVLSGMALFFLDKLSTGHLLGNIIAILSGLSFAGMILFMRKQKNGSPLESVLLGNLLTAMIGVPFMFQGPFPDVSGWIALSILGLFQLGISYILYSSAIKHVTALEAILVPVIEPLLNPFWVFCLLGERPGPWALVGGVIVLFAITSRSLHGLQQLRGGDLKTHG